MDQLSPVEIAAIVVIAVVIIGGLAVFALRSKLFRRRGGKRLRSELLNNPRVEVLETTVIDAERKLVLVRCDSIEHLVMIGGPTDVVVENDVKKVRPPTPASAGKTPPASPLAAAPPAPAPARVPPATGAAIDAAIAAAAPKKAEAPRPPSEIRAEPPVMQRRLAPPPPPRAAQRNGEAPRPAEGLRPPLRPAADEAARAAARRAPVVQPPKPAEPVRAAAVGLPSAQVPWSDPNSIENEIAQAVRMEPPRGSDSHARRGEPPAPKTVIDSSATLGDLADRLEEALAREMQSVGTGRKPAAAGNFPAESERPPRASGRDRQERRTEPVRHAGGPPAEAEGGSAAGERREEAPVINLNTRRREAADPLEDEMARLLGELTGDSKSR